MLYGLYLSATGLALNEHRQDVIANNLANVDTVAFKRDLVVFQQRRLEAQVAPSGSTFRPDHLRGATGGGFVSGVYTDFTSGSSKVTSRPLDIALSGPGFLMVRHDGRTAYSRDGRLTVANGKLVRSTDGKPVLDSHGREINVGSADLNDLRIDDGGTLWQRNEKMASIGVVEFDDLQRLTKLGGNLFESPQTPRPAGRTTVVPNTIELSGVNPAAELVAMIKSARSFQIAAEMISLHDQSLSRLVNDLPRM